MAGERDNQIKGAVCPSITEVMEGATAHGIATGAVATARAKSRRPIATAPFDVRLGQVFDTRNALGDIRDVFPGTSHGFSPDAKGVRSSFYAHRKSRRLH